MSRVSFDSSCAVQVIVMSGHETIRVLEVEVDASLPSSAPDGKSQGGAEEAAAWPAERPEVGGAHDGLTAPQSGGVGKSPLYYFMMMISR